MHVSSPAWLRRSVTLPVRFYRRYLTRWTPRTCRFQPTCSAYCVQAVHQRGILWGLALTTWRLLRCQPFGKGGYDPVPPAPGSAPGSSEPLEPPGPESARTPPQATQTFEPPAHADSSLRS